MPRFVQALVLAGLVAAAGGVLPGLFAALDDCCTGCDDADCPEESDGAGCAPQCSDCACAAHSAPVAQMQSAPAILLPPVMDPIQPTIEQAPVAPQRPGIFRPPKYASLVA